MISGFDYVDFVLKKGPYDSKLDPTDSRWENINGDRVYQTPLPTGYVSTLPPNNLLFFPYRFFPENNLPLRGPISACHSTPVSNDLQRIERLSKLLSSLLSEQLESDLERKIQSRPPIARTVFYDAISDMKQNGQRYLALARDYDRRFSELKKRWEEHSEKWKDSWDITKWWFNEGETRAQIQKEFDELKAAAERDLKQYSFNHQMLERLDQLEEFDKKATPGQKKKFVQLLQCEWEPL